MTPPRRGTVGSPNTVAAILFLLTILLLAAFHARRPSPSRRTLEIEEIERSLIRGLIQQGAAY